MRARRLRRTILLLACAVLSGVGPADAATGEHGRPPLSIRLEEAPGDSVLESFARILGAELYLDTVSGRSVTLELERAPVAVALDRVCEQLVCHWELVPGDPPVLRVESLLSLDLVRADARQVLTLFAQILDLGIEIDPGYQAEVTIHLDGVPWSDALDGLCESTGCRWGLDPATRRLRIARAEARSPEELREPPSVNLSGPQRERPPLASIKPRSTAATLRFTPPGATRSIDRRLELDWNRSIARVAAEDGGWEVITSWVPLGDRLDVLLPMLVECGPGRSDARVEGLAPVILPLAAPWAERRQGATIELLPAAPGPAAAASSHGGRSCAGWEPVRLEVYADGVFNGRHRVEGPGQFLQVLLIPTAERPRSDLEAAIVVIGRGPGAVFDLAALVVEAGGAVRLHRGTAAIGGAWTQSLTLGDGTTTLLDVRLTAEDPSP